MLFLSQLLGAPVEGRQGGRIGKLIDILAPVLVAEQQGHVYASALVIEGPEDQRWRVSPMVASWQGETLRMQGEQLTEQAAGTLADEVSLARDVLDKQVIDMERKKAVRVNDVCFSDDWQILGIDNSTVGLVRRLAPAWLLGTKRRSSTTHLINWSRIEPLSAPGYAEDEAVEPKQATGPIPRIQGGQLAELHPADVAEIVSQLTPGQGARLLAGLGDETAAAVMEELSTERQGHILENIEAGRAADILQAMGPDEAADLLARLPEERAQELLRLMTPEESEDVQELLEYEENSAGGLMTTDYIVMNVKRTAEEALDLVRANIKERAVKTAYIYCVGDERCDECALLGVVSLWDLLVAAPMQPLQALMETDVITVRPDSEPRAVAQIMAKYNLLAVPVIGPEGFLEGIVTVDDALDVLLPADKRRKQTRMY